MESWFQDIGVWLEGLGPLAYVAAPAIMALVAIFPIPAEAPAMLNGALFGPVVGSAISWVGAMIGAVISFELARALGRPLAERLLSAAALDRADRAVLRAGWWGLLVARFIPLIAFTALNWGAGLTPVSRWRFVWTTGLGILPGVILFTTSGVGLAALYRASPGLTVALVLALVALGALVWARGRGHSAEAGD